MGGFQSRRSKDELAVVASPGGAGGGDNIATMMASSPPLPHQPQALPVDLNTSLNDTQILLAGDSEWLDQSEILAQEDEDAKMVRELSASDDSPLDAWLRLRDDDIRMQVSIVNVATQNKFMGRKTVEYTIQTDTGTVKRRYKDFVALRFGLEIRFPGAVVAPLPAKRRIGKTDPLFLVKRRRMLQQFLQSVARHPFLSADDLFVEFIASTARFDRKTAWKQRTYLVKAQKWSTAARRWAQALLQSETPLSPQATMEAAMAELAAVQKHLGQLKTAIKMVSHRCGVYSTSLHDLGTSFQRSQAQEGQLVVFSGAIEQQQPNGERLTLQQVLTVGQNLSNQHGSVLEESPDMYDDSLLCPIRFEMSFNDTFLEALRRTKFSIGRHRQAVGAYRIAREQSEVGSFKNALAVTAGDNSPVEPARMIQNNADAEKQRQKLQRLRLAAVQAQMAARRDINGVLALELQRFRSERAARLTKAFDDFVRVQRSQAERIEGIWKSVGFPAISPRGSQPGGVASASVSANAESAGATSRPQLSEQDAMNNSMLDLKPPTRRASQLRAKYPFQGENEDELDVNEGDVLVGEEDDINPEWVRAKSLVTGKEGLVPRTYVEEIEADAPQNGEEDEYDSHDEQGDSNSGLPEPPPTAPMTNYIKQTQDMFNKGTKRTSEDREQF